MTSHSTAVWLWSALLASIGKVPADPRWHCGPGPLVKQTSSLLKRPTFYRGGCLGCTRLWASGSRIAAGWLYAVTAAVVRVWQNPAAPPPDGDPPVRYRGSHLFR